MSAQVTESTVTLPAVGRQNIAFICSVEGGKAPRPPLGYLHSVRSSAGQAQAELLNTLRQGYLAELPGYAGAFEAWAIPLKFDAIILVPSSRCDARPFADAVLRATPSARDLSQHLLKSAGWKSGTNNALDEARANIQAIDLDAKSLTSIAIIDETLSSGNSAAVVLELLRENGLSTEAVVWLVVPLVLQNLAV